MATKRKGKRNTKKTFLQIIGGLVIAFAVLMVLAIGTFIYYAWKAPSFNEASLRDQLPTKIYDKNNELATVLYMGQRREEVKFEDIPDQMRNAVLATEDNRFYEHGALDFKRLSGAVIKNITGGFGSQGASTLTQQVVKRSFLTDKKSIERKAQEAYLSYRLEQEYSKNDIFEMYMNKIYYSDGVYGIKTAAHYYFNKDLNNLTLAESAYLAGLPQVPNTYNIYDNPEAAEKRKDTVLYLMNRHNRITKEQMEEAQNEDLSANLVPRTAAERQNIDENDPVYASYINVIKKEIMTHKEFKGQSLNDVLTSGLKVYTNMDKNVQQDLQNNVDNLSVYKNKDQQAAATILDTQTGGLVAISGGRNYQDIVDRNLATDPHAVGSIIKPFLSYGPIIQDLKYPTHTLIQDEQVLNINGNEFRNYDTQSHGMVTMREALRKSYNVPALKLFEEEKKQVGPDAPYNFAKKVNLNYESSDLGPAEALGGGASEFSTVQMAAAFSAFGNGGTYNQVQSIRKVVTRDDETIKFEHSSHKAMEDYTAYMVTDILKDVFTYNGTAPYMIPAGLNAAGKTGTATYADETYQKYQLPSDAAKDVWIAGYSPQYTMTVWMGFTSTKPYGENSFVGHVEQALPQSLFKTVMTDISPIDGQDFEKPDSVIEVGNELQVNSSAPPKKSTITSSEVKTEAAGTRVPAASVTNETVAEPETFEMAPTERPFTERATIETEETAEPVTERPATPAPTTEVSTTERATTELPATAAPTTEPPTTAAPTTEPPTTAAPTTEPPTIAAPKTELPTTAAPASSPEAKPAPSSEG
ncbi:penicillin-binding protein [Macrococcus hajekii]|uniref:Penicillin-binding protein n=1 Tax=Macrococcus hajekii TaxID=198482 RepID=A0A4R6BMV9_9STAP|nr:transglycosylase domain-containing protein [Macrococcus hajekii]TDM03007.1 penicillin-binding protein [Macrococcus hajekii]GGB05755.1 penicillin-binding protein 2 [Macrococcus hajekii]